MFPELIKNLFRPWITETFLEELPEEPNIKIITTIESLTLFLRYLTIIVVLIGYILETFSQKYFVPIFLISIIVHILYTHFVFYTKKYSLFTNPINFFLYLLIITTAVIVTEKEYSPLILFYPLLILGNMIYARRKPHPFLITLLHHIFEFHYHRYLVISRNKVCHLLFILEKFYDYHIRLFLLFPIKSYQRDKKTILLFATRTTIYSGNNQIHSG